MAVSASALHHPGRACRHTLPTWDARYLRCEIQGCQSVWRIPTPPAPAQSHSRTSREAAGSLQGRDFKRQAVLDAFRKAGPVHANPPPFGIVGGLTDEELVEVLNMPSSTARPRRVELVRDGLLMDSSHTRKTRSNRAATVWMVAVGS